LQNAEALYRAVLQKDPNHAEANHNLGVLALSLEQTVVALPLLKKALELNASQAQFWISYIEALIKEGHYESAQSVLLQGKSRGLSGNKVDELFKALNNKKIKQDSLTSKGKSNKKESVSTVRNHSTKQPSKAEINLLMSCYLNGDVEAAEKHASSFTMRYRNHLLGWKVLGWSLKKSGNLAESLLAHQRAVEIAPNDPEAVCNLGTVSSEIGQLLKAEKCFREAINLDKDMLAAYFNLGNTLRKLTKLQEAEKIYKVAIGLNQDFFGAHANLGSTLHNLGRTEEALLCYQRALELKPDAALFHSNLLFCKAHIESVSSQELFDQHCEFANRFEAPLIKSWPQHTNLPDPNKTIRIGFVSGDLRKHAVASFLEPVLSFLSRDSQLSLHAYYNYTLEDATSERLKCYFLNWNNIVHLSDEDLAKKIREDRIDILIDLSSHTAHNRLLTFARKPAPVQASWIGYPGTTGLKAIDYYISDQYHLPLDIFGWQFTEKIVHLPSVAVFSPYEILPSIAQLPATSNGYITFGSFNRTNKITRSVVALWSQLLRAVPSARMLLGAMPLELEDIIWKDWFKQEGIDLDRLSFKSRCSMEDYLQLYDQVDICLDTFPYNGGTTTWHALWMGVPVLSISGDTPMSRGGACILGAVGLSEFVAKDKEEFVHKGVAWANNINQLSKLRVEMRERIGLSDAGQTESIAHLLSEALRIMWKRWCQKLPPQAFTVQPKVKRP
jgi:predicted O-linked N-acetylglucosamine transferase (SPINDLY family)